MNILLEFDESSDVKNVRENLRKNCKYRENVLKVKSSVFNFRN